MDIIHRINGVTRIAVHTSKAHPSVEEFTGLLGRSNIAVTEFYLERATLDDVFRQITNHGGEN